MNNDTNELLNERMEEFIDLHPPYTSYPFSGTPILLSAHSIILFTTHLFYQIRALNTRALSATQRNLMRENFKPALNT